MTQALRHLDRLLRGDATRTEALRAGRIEVPAGGLAGVGILLGVIYGVCMGVFSLTGAGSGAHMQIVASAVKVPVLFLLTLLVTFPSLYVFSALMGSRMAMVSVLRLLVAAIAIMMAVLASLGPIVAFFSLTTTSYSFMTVLNVMVFALAGVLSGAFLLRTLRRVMVAAEVAAMQSRPAVIPPPLPGAEGAAGEGGLRPSISAPPAQVSGAGMQEDMGGDARGVFRIWIVVFGLVGGQMSWILRPFIGDPGMKFEWFRRTGDSNFFSGVWHAVGNLF